MKNRPAGVFLQRFYATKKKAQSTGKTHALRLSLSQKNYFLLFRYS